MYISIRGVIVAENAIAVNGVIINNLARIPMRKGISRIKCSELTTMVMEFSTKEVWISYQSVCYQDIPSPRFDDGYPEEAQTGLYPHLERACHGGERSSESESVWSQSETAIYALGSSPSIKPTELTAYQ